MAGENVNRRLNIYINDREVTNSLTGVTREMSKVRAQMRGLNKGTEDYQEQLDKLNREYQDLEEAQTQFKKDIYGVKKGFDDAKNSAEEMTGELDAAGSAFGNLWEGIKTGNMKQAQEGLNGLKTGLQDSAKAAMSFIATPVGAVVAGLIAVGAGAKALWDYNAGLTEMNRLLENLGIDKNARSQIEALSKVYEVEFDKIASSVDNLVDLGLVKNEFEALEQIKNELAKAPNSNEFVEMLDSNGIAAKNLGLQLSEIIALNKSFESSGSNSQAVFGALNKSSSTLILQSEGLQKTLSSSLGSGFTSDLLQKVRTGSITYYEALDQIYQQGEKIKVSDKEKAEIAKELFGKSSIAAGGYEGVLSNVAAAHKKGAEGLTENQKATNDLVEAQTRLNEAQSDLFEIDGFASSWNNIKAIAIDAFAVFLEGISEFKTDIQPLIDLVAIVFANAWEGIKFTVKNAFEIIGGAFKIVGNTIKTWVNVITKLFKGDFSGAFQAAVDGLQNSAKIIGNIFIGLKNNLLTALSNIVENVAPMLEALGLDVDKIKKKLESWKSQKFELKGEVKVKEPKEKGSDNNPNRPPSKDTGTEADKKAAEERAKAALKAAEERKKLLEQQAKEREALDKQLLATQRAFQDAQLELMADGYEKEKAKINLEYDRKIEDLKSHLFKESELKDLQNQIDAAKNSGNKGESERLQNLLNQKLAINDAYNKSIIAAEQTRNLKIGQLQEKYLAEEFKKEQEAHARQLKNLQTQQNFELNGITSLKDAKALLSETMSSDELKRVTSLEQAKKLIKEQHLKAQFELEKANLEKISSQLQTLMALDAQSGFQLFSEEERDAVLKNLEEVANKISGLKKPEETKDFTQTDNTFDNAANTGVDILGFDAGKWEALFDGLDTFAEKLAAVQMVAGALKNAFNAYFSFMEAGENRTLQKFQKSTEAKKRALADQLEKGYITQEVYNARVAQADEELNRKKADLEYKQAKRKRAMAIVEAIINTAQAISGALAATPGPGGIIMAAIVGAFGALQIATIARQPLPDKGYKTGGFTTRGNRSEIAGVTHKDEYVIPANVLYDDDPAMPNIMSYIEGKRTGRIKTGGSSDNDNNSSGSPSSKNSNNELFLASVIERNSDLIEKAMEEGFAAWLELDVPTAKRIRKKLQDLEKIEKDRKK